EALRIAQRRCRTFANGGRPSHSLPLHDTAPLKYNRGKIPLRRLPLPGVECRTAVVPRSNPLRVRVTSRPRARRQVGRKRKSSMAKQLSPEQFLRNLSDSGLFSQEEMDAILRDRPAPQEVDGEAVARRLIAAGKLTPFQAAAVRER